MAPATKVDESWYTPVAEIDPLVDRVRKCAQSRKTHSLAWRRSQLQAILTMIEENSDALQQAHQKDMGQGKHYFELFELATVKNMIQFAFDHLEEWTSHRRVPTPFPTNLTQPVYSELTSYPRGLVLLMSPWNFPVGLILNPLVNAISAGNCCIIKPSELSVNTSQVLGPLIEKYMDPEAVAVVQGDAEQATELLRHRWDAIAYTGGLRVAKIVAAAAAPFLTPLLLELGGKTPCIVCEDAQVEAAAMRVAWAKWAGNCGQFCIAPDYVLVVEPLKQKFIQCLKKNLMESYGDNPKEAKDYGRMITEAHGKRVVDLIDTSCTVLHGNQDRHAPSERYVEPTIVEATAKSKVMQEEIFGPIMAIIGVPSTEAAITFVNENFNNHNHHPLALYVFSRSTKKQRQVLDNVMSGMACVNHVVLMGGNFYLPFGGVGYSGMSAYYGKHGFDLFSHSRGVMVLNNHSASRMDPGNWLLLPPYTKTKTKILSVMGKAPVLMGQLTTLIKWSLPVMGAMLVYRCPTQVREFNVNTIIGWVQTMWPSKHSSR